MWRALRAKRLGPQSPLPSTIEEMLPYDGAYTQLNENKIERKKPNNLCNCKKVIDMIVEVSGPSGVGKTTLILYLVDRASHEGYKTGAIHSEKLNKT